MIEHLKSVEEFTQENDCLRAKLEEVTEVLTAIRTGEVDALVVDGPNGEQVFTLHGADRPYRTFVETMNEAAVTLARDGTIVYCNHRFAELVGTLLEQTIGRSFLPFVASPDRPELDLLLAQKDAAGSRAELSLEQSDGTAIPVRISIRCLPEDCGDYWCLVITDLRGQKLQEALRKSEAQVAIELTDRKLLQSVSGEIIREENVEALYHKILDAAMELMQSDMASMQMVTGNSEGLLTVGSRGFASEAGQASRLNDDWAKTASGIVMREGSRVIVSDVEACNFIAGTPALDDHRNSGIRSFQSTPLLSRSGRMVGILSTYWRIPLHPSDRKLSLLDILARQAADLLERRSGEEALRRWNIDLEQEVGRRTEELLESRERLRALATELNLTEQRERKRMAIELHDYLAQLLALAIMNLSQIKQKQELAPTSSDLINKTHELIIDALNYTRTLVTDLTPPMLHDFGLPTALRWLVEQMQRHQLSVTIEMEGLDGIRFPEDQALLLFQSIRELLINVAKHGRTGEATVSLTQCSGELRVEVRDRGKGFNVHSQGQDGNPTNFGLFNIRERMQAIGGSFEIESQAEKGTKAILVLPLRGKDSVGCSAKVPLQSTIDRQASSKSTQASIAELTNREIRGQSIRVLLVDDHAMVRQGLRSLLNGYADIEVVGEASNGDEALTSVVVHQPDIVIMDINMPKMNGIQTTAIIKSHYPNIKVIGLSVQASEEMQHAMTEVGASVLLTKEAAVEQLYQTIQALQHSSENR